jgi:hypothetical protein
MGHVLGSNWTPEDKERLIALTDAGHIDNDIARVLERPVQAVSAQRILLGILPNRARR